MRMRISISMMPVVSLATFLLLPMHAGAIELRITRDALERTLKQQLFNGPDGRYYLKGDAKSACQAYAEKPVLSFAGDRMVVKVETHAKLGMGLLGMCLGVTLAPTAQVSMVPDAEGETIGFRDVKVEKVAESKELNFLLQPLLNHEIPARLKMNAADVIRRALEGSTLTTGYRVNLERLQIHSMVVKSGKDGDWLVLDVDGGLTVK